MNSKNFQGLSRKSRMTHQRRVILEELRKVKTHPNADEVYDLVRKVLPRISLGTVYRNLEMLSACGLIQKIGPISSQMRYDSDTENHYHLRCIRCGKAVDAPIATLDDLDNLSHELSDFTILGHRLEFIGICSECANKEKSVP